MDGSSAADEVGRRAERSETFGRSVRVGLVSYGTVHLLVAWLAVRLAFGDRAGSPSSQGALHEVAQQPLGNVLLWVVGLGFVALVAWQLVEAVSGHRDEDGMMRLLQRGKAAGKGLVYGTLGFLAVKTALGAGSSGNTDTLTAQLMALPFGPLLVGAVGAVVGIVGVAHVYKGFTEYFVHRLTVEGQAGASGVLYVALGKLGYLAKGVALLVVAGLFLWAAWSHDPRKSGGLDQALRMMLEQPYGKALLTVVAAGLGCYGVFCFVWARHLDQSA